MGQETIGHVQPVSHTLGVVVTTYEWPEALDAVLWALSEQSDPDFDIVVAEDGSDPPTARIVDRWRRVFGSRLGHVRQADDGFRAARTRNLGALASDADLLVFLDGDCVPRRDFVRGARASACAGWFGIGRRLHLPRELTARVLAQAIPIHRWSTARWVPEWRHGIEIAALTARDRRTIGRLGVPEFAPHANAYSPFLVAATDFRSVNGFDMAYEGWGEEDVDLAVRLRRLGLHCGHTGPSGTVVHLWHPPRAKRERPNWWRLEKTKQGTAHAAADGLGELEQELVSAGAPSVRH